VFSSLFHKTVTVCFKSFIEMEGTSFHFWMTASTRTREQCTRVMAYNEGRGGEEEREGICPSASAKQASKWIQKFKQAEPGIISD
jgi:hypothetical protein